MRSQRKRHVLFVVHRVGPPVNEKQLSQALRRSILMLYGETAVADSRFYLDKYDEATGIGILQCTSESLSNVLTAACVISSVGESRVSFDPKLTSGTIKGLAAGQASLNNLYLV